MKKEIGVEYPPVDEPEYIAAMVEELQNQMVELFPNGTRMLRQAESKMHGCLKATFTVNPELDQKYRIGLFRQPGKSYDAIIRFSNAKTGIVADSKKDQRGMAVKLVGVEGPKLMLDKHDAVTHDLIALNKETFVSKSVKEFHGLIKAFTSGKLKLLLFALNPLHLPLMLRVSKGASKIGSLLEQNYYSTTAYEFGQGKAVKFMFRTSLNADTPIPKDPDPDYLRHQMAAFLKESDVSFDFLVQFQEDADKMPIEDPTKKWSSRYVKLATLHIPRQDFDQDKNRRFGEALAYNPWHCIPEHRPLGGLNRARLAIYGTLAEFRNAANGISTFEPTDMSFNLNDSTSDS